MEHIHTIRQQYPQLWAEIDFVPVPILAASVPGPPGQPRVYENSLFTAPCCTTTCRVLDADNGPVLAVKVAQRSHIGNTGNADHARPQTGRAETAKPQTPKAIS